MILLFLLIALLLLLLNGFFVLAEFAAVKMRPSRIEELIENGVHGAKAVQHVQDHLDEYLSVCQLGITFASIGLGVVAEPAVVTLIEPVVIWSGLFQEESASGWVTAHAVAFIVSYILVSFLHILVGELIPKSAAIRVTDWASQWTAPPLRFFRFLFYVPLKLLNACANFVLALMGLRDNRELEIHSEDELRILMSQTQTGSAMTFRRLLFMENVFDLGELQVKDAMRSRSQVRTLNANLPWSSNLEQLKKHRFSRYPLVERDNSDPIGVIHIKDLILIQDHDPDLRQLKRSFITVNETAMLETLLADMQRQRIHVAIVRNSQGNWVGYLTLEDVIEELIGTIRDEFEDEEQTTLADAISESRIWLGIEAESSVDAIRTVFQRMPEWNLPVSKEAVIKAIDDRERVVETYLGKDLGMPHARIMGLQNPVVFFIRSEQGISYRNNQELAHLLFVVLSPAGHPRVHQRLQAVIATIMDESEFVPARLKAAETSKEVLEILKTSEQATLD